MHAACACSLVNYSHDQSVYIAVASSLSPGYFLVCATLESWSAGNRDPSKTILHACKGV